MGDPAIDELAEALERTLGWLRRNTPPDEWSAVALSTLDALDRHGPLRITDLVARERITQPGMTGLAARLENAGLVERRADPGDGRVTLVAITPAGREHMRAFHRGRAAAVAAHVRLLSARDQRALLAACGALKSLSAMPATHEEG